MAQCCCESQNSVTITGEYPGFVVQSAVNTLLFNADLCINCEMCLAVCPQGVFASGESVIQIIKQRLPQELGVLPQF